MLKRTLLTLSLLTLISGCASTRGTPDERRTAVQEMRTDVIGKLYEENPSSREEIASSPGYGVFSNANINLLLASFGGGFGVIRDNRTGTDTYMKMGEVGVGLGAGVKDYRIVMVFHDAETMSDFVEKGWSFGAQADAAAKASDKGAAAGAEAILDGDTVYQITETGLALQATIKGTKFWKDDELN